jgi:hypothetical protein
MCDVATNTGYVGSTSKLGNFDFSFAVWTGVRAGQKSNIHNPIKNRL